VSQARATDSAGETREETKKPALGPVFFRRVTGYFLVSVVVVVVPVVVVVLDGALDASDGVVVVVEDGVVTTVVVVVLLAGAAAGASAGLISIFVVAGGVTSVLVQPITPMARRAARIYGDFIVRVP
jgi:hypothetical protein